MAELKKTFLAGFSVLMVLLLAPYYLQWIGYNDTDNNTQIQVDILEDKQNITKELYKSNKDDFELPPATDSLLIKVRGEVSEKTFSLSTELYEAQISSVGGGSLTAFHLKNYQGNWEGSKYNDQGLVELVSYGGDKLCAPCVSYNGKAIDIPFEECRLEGGDPLWSSGQTIDLTENKESFSLVCDITYLGSQITKKTTFYSNSFVVDHSISTVNNNKQNHEFGLIWDKGLNQTEENVYDDVSYSGVSFSANKEIESSSFIPQNIDDMMDSFSSIQSNIDWAAMRTKYFILAVLPKTSQEGFGQASFTGTTKSIAQGLSLVPVYSLNISQRTPIAGDAVIFQTYLGPLDIDYINELNTTLDRIMNFGWFIIQPFSRGILWLLKSLYGLGLNYGVILILFAFLVRVVTGPLTKKSFESTQNMQAIQPKLKKIQDKYKSDPQKLNAEMVKLYRDNGVNPLGGCLPMLLQMPLLFSLFLVFRSTIEFRGAPFIWWIKDLSLPDTIFHLPFYIPIYGDQVAFLPLLLGISMFLTQKMSMANMDTGMGQQKYMMYFMSAFFFLIFNSFPSGLNLYYLIYNILNYLQQKSLKKA